MDLDPALSFCTHLVYGYAGIQSDTYKMVSLNPNLDVDRSHANYRALTNFKTKYPGLKVLLSVGGDVDIEEKEKYNLLVSLFFTVCNKFIRNKYTNLFWYSIGDMYKILDERTLE